MLLEPLAQKLVEDALDDRAHFGGDQLVLRLRRELWVRHFYGEHAGQALAAIVAGEINLLFLREAGALGITGDLSRQRGAEAGEMRAAVALRDVVRKREHILVVGIVPPQSDFDSDAVALAAHHDRRRNQRLLGAVEIT